MKVQFPLGLKSEFFHYIGAWYGVTKYQFENMNAEEQNKYLFKFIDAYS